jgi:hypothetical protein
MVNKEVTITEREKWRRKDKETTTKASFNLKKRAGDALSRARVCTAATACLSVPAGAPSAAFPTPVDSSSVSAWPLRIRAPDPRRRPGLIRYTIVHSFLGRQQIKLPKRMSTSAK